MGTLDAKKYHSGKSIYCYLACVNMSKNEEINNIKQ